MVMQKVKVETVLFYKRGDDNRPAGKDLRLEGIESMFKSLSFPKKGMTFLYGHRNPAHSYLLKYAGISGLGAAIVDISVEIGQWPRFKASLADDPDRGLRFTGVLSLARVLKEIVDKANDVAQKKAGVVRLIDKGVVSDPSVLDYVIADDTFSHLVMIAYLVETAEAGTFQVATVFNLEKLTDITTAEDLKDITLYLDR